MGNYSQDLVEELINNLDALDVLELIDYHPESIQMDGNSIKAYCPLCQDTSDRYLTVNTVEKTFRSESPMMPPQTGNIVDLYSRARRIGFDEAVSELADEFGILLVDKKKSTEEIIDEAESIVADAKTGEEDREVRLQEAEKYYTMILKKDPENRRALEGIVKIRLVQANPMTLGPAVKQLIQLDKAKGNNESIIRIAHDHLEIVPSDLEVQDELAQAYARSENHEDAANVWWECAAYAKRAGMVNEAIEYYKNVARLPGYTEKGLDKLIDFLKEEGRPDDAKKIIQDLVDSLKNEKQYRKASKMAARKLMLSPGNGEIIIQVVELLILAGLDDDDLEVCLTLIEELLRADKLADASEALSYLLAEKPDDPRVLDLQVDTYVQMGQYEMVEEFLPRLIDIYKESGQVEEAEKKLLKMASEDPMNARLVEIHGDLLMSQKKESEAVQRYRDAVDVYLSSMEEQKALETVQKICQMDPKQWEEREREIEMLWAMGKREEEKEKLLRLTQDLDEAGLIEKLKTLHEGQLKRSPDFPLSLAYMYRVEAKSSNQEAASKLLQALKKQVLSNDKGNEAIVSLKDLYAKEPKNVEVLQVLSEVLIEKKELDEAADYCLALADIYKESGNWEKELSLLEDMQKVFPESTKFLSRLFEGYEAAEQNDKAKKYASKLMDVHFHAKDFEKALPYAEFLYSINKRSEVAVKNLISVCKRMDQPQRELKLRFELAEILHEAGKHSEEAKVYQAILEKSPDDVDLMEKVLTLHSENKNNSEVDKLLPKYLERTSDQREKTLPFLQSFLEKVPEATAVRLELINYFKDKGKNDEVLKHLQVAVEQLEEKGDHEKLLGLYEELLQQTPDNVFAKERYVELLRNEGKSDLAVSHHFELAKLYIEGKKLKDAELAFEKILEDDPDNIEALEEHIKLLEQMQKREAADQKRRTLASTLAQKGKTSQAIALLKKILENDPADIEVRRQIVDILKEAKEIRAAADELEGLAEIHKKLGETSKVMETYREAVSLLPDSTNFRRQLVEELMENGRTVEAQVERLNLSENLSKSGQPQKALNEIQIILDDTPGNIRARQLRAQIYDNLGEEKKALDEYREMQSYLSDAPLSPRVAMSDNDDELSEDQFPGLQVLPEYDFNSFIVGNKNNFAYATAKAVADKPGTVHNPLFLYSDVGLGKTHLLHAIANHLKKKSPNIRILYASTEYFTSALIDAIQNNKVTSFRNLYRRSDLLLLDDVQFLAGKERSQEEFFHIFNILHQDRRQIVVTSDRPPKDIAHLDMRIRSRFGQGVIVDIQPPDVETRIAILKAEASRREVEVPDEAVTLIAEKVSSNVRELKGAFNQLLMQHELVGDTLSVETANTIIDKFYTT